MTTKEAVERAIEVHKAIMAEAGETRLDPTIEAALIVSATIYQALDWVEDKLQQIVHYMPDGSR